MPDSSSPSRPERTATVKAVFFDLDGTLYPTRSCYVDAARAVHGVLVAEAGCTQSPDEFVAEWNAIFRELERETPDLPAIHDRCYRLMRYGERHSVPLRLVATLDDLYWTVYLNGITAYGDAAATFDALHARGVSVGVGTNMSTHWQLRKLERCGLVDKVDFLVTSEIAGAEKPSAAFFGHCLRKAGVAPENCLFVGDNPVADIQGATDAGIRAR